LKPDNEIRELSEKFDDKHHALFLGRGVQYPVAMEGALKLKEISYIHAEGFAGGELKHGTLALIEKGTPVIVFVANEAVKKEILSNAMEVKARGGYIIGISPENNEIFDEYIPVPDLAPVSPIVNVIPAQLLAYHLAVLRGNDPDKPRNLAKSVTVKSIYILLLFFLLYEIRTIINRTTLPSQGATAFIRWKNRQSISARKTRADFPDTFCFSR